MIKQIVTVALITGLGATTATANASEYESAWQETNQCYAQYEQTLRGLPSTETASLDELLAAYDRHANETRCTVMFGVTEGHLESIGYFTIVEYRDDLYHRKQRYSAVLDMYSDWTAEVKIKRPDFNAALESRKKQKRKPRDEFEITKDFLRVHTWCSQQHPNSGDDVDQCIKDNPVARYE